jgi:hypothetical protein
MRLCLPAIAACVFTGCTSTFAKPLILVSPYLAVYRFRGDLGMQSPAPGGGLEDNARQPLRTFGQDHFREDVGVRADIGDGFGGVRFDYYRLDQGTARSGVLGDDWGTLQSGDPVQMRVAMDELRVGWLEPFLRVRTEWRDQPLTLRLAAGGVLSHRDLALKARTLDGSRTQNANIDGETIAAAIRFRASWRDFGFELDYALSPDDILGGDFVGLQQDGEAKLTWTMPLHDVTFFAGYRYSDIEVGGSDSGFRYAGDLVLDGFQFGVGLTF